MKLNVMNQTQRATRWSAFTLVEVLVAMALVGITFVSLYTAISSGFAVINVARENLRATQILLEKMETLRLYNWNQINSNGFIPPTFTAPDSPLGNTNSGLMYQGTMTITNAPASETYSNDLRVVILQVSWTSGRVLRQREMQTLVSRYGLQNYIY
jgi:prepilin-type N-terminal cleavage/methylation domain-containing protein